MAVISSPKNYLELKRVPRIGVTVVLPAGLRYCNEYFGAKSIASNAFTVRITDVQRDEFFWRDDLGHECSARWRQTAA